MGVEWRGVPPSHLPANVSAAFRLFCDIEASLSFAMRSRRTSTLLLVPRIGMDCTTFMALERPTFATQSLSCFFVSPPADAPDGARYR